MNPQKFQITLLDSMAAQAQSSPIEYTEAQLRDIRVQQYNAASAQWTDLVHRDLLGAFRGAYLGHDAEARNENMRLRAENKALREELQKYKDAHEIISRFNTPEAIK